jgi:hypothetical protein
VVFRISNKKEFLPLVFGSTTSDPHALLDQIATKTFKPVENFGKQLTSDRSGFSFGFGFGFGFGSAG